MVYRISSDEMKRMLFRQVESFYSFSEEERGIVNDNWDAVLKKTEYCFSNNRNKYYSRMVEGNRETYFDALHTCQWLVFLYKLSSAIYRSNIMGGGTQDSEKYRLICDKIYGVSKTMSGADLYYEVNLPEIFTCDHPVGSVMGRAAYGDYFSFTQGCTVGNNHGVYPVIGHHVSMKSNSKIIGNSHIGNNVIISANSYVKDQDVPDDSIVFGSSPDIVIRKNKTVL